MRLAIVLGLALAGWVPQARAQAPVPAAVASPLTSVRRIFVEPFAQDATSQQAQAMVVTALVASKRFVVTEVREKADAVLRGTASVRTSHEVHAFGEGTSVGAAEGAAAVSGDHAAAAVAARHMGANDSSLDTETDERATVSVRLVSSDGDVIWSTTQESNGGKYEGASVGAVEECVKQLLRDARASAAAPKGGN